MNKLIERILKTPLGIKLGVIALAVALITGACWFFVISDTMSAIEVNEAQIQSLSDELANKRRMADELSRFIRDIETLQVRFEEARNELPVEADIDVLLSQLNDVGKKSGLDIVTLEPSTETLQDFYAVIPIQMQVAGSYHEIALFFENISKLRRIVNITGLSFDQPVRKNEKVFLRANYLATTFRFVGSSNKRAK
jgi:type IV pilus assembly protein PilO